MKNVDLSLKMNSKEIYVYVYLFSTISNIENNVRFGNWLYQRHISIEHVRSQNMYLPSVLIILMHIYYHVKSLCPSWHVQRDFFCSADRSMFFFLNWSSILCSLWYMPLYMNIRLDCNVILSQTSKYPSNHI